MTSIVIYDTILGGRTMTALGRAIVAHMEANNERSIKPIVDRCFWTPTNMCFVSSQEV
jgi:hypothetical protein